MGVHELGYDNASANFDRGPLRRMRWFAIAILISVLLDIAWSTGADIYFSGLTGWTLSDILYSIRYAADALLLLCVAAGLLLFPTRADRRRLAAACWFAAAMIEAAVLLLGIVAEDVTWSSFSSISILPAWWAVAIALAACSWTPARVRWHTVLLTTGACAVLIVMLNWTSEVFEWLAGQQTLAQLLSNEVARLKTGATGLNAIATTYVACLGVFGLSLPMLFRRPRIAVNLGTSLGLAIWNAATVIAAVGTVIALGWWLYRLLEVSVPGLRDGSVRLHHVLFSVSYMFSLTVPFVGVLWPRWRRTSQIETP